MAQVEAEACLKAEPVAERFWRYVDKTDNCWNWTGCKVKGYGYIIDRLGTIDGCKMWRAHRLSYRIHKGDPIGKVVRHTCDNPMCVNPAHLILGSQTNNIHDCMLKLRHRHRLSMMVARVIRRLAELGWKHREIADLYRISRSGVSRIIRKERWNHDAVI